jgi:threonine-phosphate decarboxylase
MPCADLVTIVNAKLPVAKLKCEHEIKASRPMIDRIKRSFASARVCTHGGKFREAASIGPAPLDFSANINPLGSPPLEAVVLKELERIGYYPDNRYMEFRQAAARFVDVGPENIVPGNGSSELIRLFAEMTLGDGGLALIPQPTFGEYENQSLLAGGRVRRIDIGPDGMPLFSDSDLSEAKAAFVCNPNNPTGVLLPREEVASLAERCEESKTFLLVDEAFIELSDPDQSVAGLAPKAEYLFVMRSLTKSFGVPGLRLGFGVANPVVAEIVDTARIPWSLGSIAAAAGSYLLGEEDFLERSRTVIREELEYLTSALQGLGLRPLESMVNFILVDVTSSGLASDDLASRMMAEGVLVRDCQSFGLGKGYIRVAVRNRNENEQLISALERVLKCRG